MIRYAVLAALVLPLAPATAQETRASVAAKFHDEFVRSDANHNGSLSEAEVEARVDRMTSTTKPMTAAQKHRLATLWFSRADLNHDGKVTEAEAQALLARTFDLYDANHDGRIGDDERAAAARGMRGR